MRRIVSVLTMVFERPLLTVVKCTIVGLAALLVFAIAISLIVGIGVDTYP